MKNTLTDLNNYLFESIERLNDDDLDNEKLDKEIKRSEAISKIAKTIIDNGVLALAVKKNMDEFGNGDEVELPMIGKINENTSETIKNLRGRLKKLEDWR